MILCWVVAMPEIGKADSLLRLTKQFSQIPSLHSNISLELIREEPLTPDEAIGVVDPEASPEAEEAPAADDAEMLSADEVCPSVQMRDCLEKAKLVDSFA